MQWSLSSSVAPKEAGDVIRGEVVNIVVDMVVQIRQQETKRVNDVQKRKMVHIDANLVIQANIFIITPPNFIYQNGVTNTIKNNHSYGEIRDGWVWSIFKPRVVEVPLISSEFKKHQNVKIGHNLRI